MWRNVQVLHHQWQQKRSFNFHFTTTTRPLKKKKCCLVANTVTVPGTLWGKLIPVAYNGHLRSPKNQHFRPSNKSHSLACTVVCNLKVIFPPPLKSISYIKSKLAKNIGVNVTGCCGLYDTTAPKEGTTSKFSYLGLVKILNGKRGLVGYPSAHVLTFETRKIFLTCSVSF